MYLLPLALLIIVVIIGTFSNVYAESLPQGTVVSSMFVPYGDEFYSKSFPGFGPQSVSFHDPSWSVKKIISTVTTHVHDAKLHFNSNGESYSYSISPNSNTVLIFEKPIKISDVSISIGGRLFATDAVSVGYDDGIDFPSVREYPIDGNPTGHALCITPANECNEMIKSTLFEYGLSVLSLEEIPDELSSYNIVVLTDIGGGVLSKSEILKEYVNEGGSLAFIAGSSYWLQQTDHEWLGFSSAKYTWFGETAEVTIDSPFGSELTGGAILKAQSDSERGAQYVTGVDGKVVAEYGNGETYAYYKNSGQGKIYYQADINPSLSGDEGLNNLTELLNAGIGWLLGNPLKIETEPPSDEEEKFTASFANTKKRSSTTVESMVSYKQPVTEQEFLDIPVLFPNQKEYNLWIIPVVIPPISYPLIKKLLVQNKTRNVTVPPISKLNHSSKDSMSNINSSGSSSHHFRKLSVISDNSDLV